MRSGSELPRDLEEIGEFQSAPWSDEREGVIASPIEMRSRGDGRRRAEDVSGAPATMTRARGLDRVKRRERVRHLFLDRFPVVVRFAGEDGLEAFAPDEVGPVRGGGLVERLFVIFTFVAFESFCSST